MAAKEKKASVNNMHKTNKKISRPGIHSKKKTSRLKTSKNYKKAYKKQGR
jgi:hypothetical protein